MNYRNVSTVVGTNKMHNGSFWKSNTLIGCLNAYKVKVNAVDIQWQLFKCLRQDDGITLIKEVYVLVILKDFEEVNLSILPNL